MIKLVFVLEQKTDQFFRASGSVPMKALSRESDGVKAKVNFLPSATNCRSSSCSNPLFHQQKASHAAPLQFNPSIQIQMAPLRENSEVSSSARNDFLFVKAARGGQSQTGGRGLWGKKWERA